MFPVSILLEDFSRSPDNPLVEEKTVESFGEAGIPEVRFRRSPQTSFEAEMLTVFREKEIYDVRIILDSSKLCLCGSERTEFQGAYSLLGREIPIVIHVCPECRCVEWKCPKGSGFIGGIFFSFTSFQKAPKRVLWDV